MSKTFLSISALSAVFAGAVLSASPAHAHINMDGPLKDRGGSQKPAPCGGATRSATPYEFEPGATIQLGVDEFIFHDGYFRIAFDNDGDDSFKLVDSIKPVNPNRFGPGKACETPDKDSCGKSDFCNVVSKDGGPTVLWDNLDPHITPTAQGKRIWNWTVTLPNVECENCTLQVIQVMEDPVGVAHGPFDNKSDVYYRCVDIKLKKGVGKTPGTVDAPLKNNGIDCLNPANTFEGGIKDFTAKPDAGTAPVAPKPDAGTAAAPAQTDGGPLGLMFGDPQASEDAESVSADAGGCSLASHEGGRWSGAALAMLMGGLLVARSRRRRS